MDDDNEPTGRARLRLVEDDERSQYHWLLLIPLLVLGYGLYTQFDRLRDLLTPDPVVVTPSLPSIPAPVSTAGAPAPAPAPVAAAAVGTMPVAEAKPQTDSVPPPSPPTLAPPLRALFPAPSETVRASGKAGLVDALRKGELRLANAGDIGRWKSRHARSAGNLAGRSFDEHISHMDAYLVVKDFEIPEGLAGADAVVFVVESRAPFPRGDAGHSPILDIDSGACVGVICSMLAED